MCAHVIELWRFPHGEAQQLGKNLIWLNLQVPIVEFVAEKLYLFVYFSIQINVPEFVRVRPQ